MTKRITNVVYLIVFSCKSAFELPVPAFTTVVITEAEGRHQLLARTQCTHTSLPRNSQHTTVIHTHTHTHREVAQGSTGRYIIHIQYVLLM
jgi:hypothetical protein